MMLAFLSNVNEEHIMNYKFEGDELDRVREAAKILRESAEKVLQVVKLKDPLLDIAQRLEEKARADSYFIDRNLYPNVDFYSGLILKAIGIPVDMFTVMFAIGRMPGWIAHWYEVASQTKGRITRPRKIYTGYERRDYIKMRNRDGEKDMRAVCRRGKGLPHGGIP